MCSATITTSSEEHILALRRAVLLDGTYLKELMPPRDF
jgi:hypothetical protein